MVDAGSQFVEVGDAGVVGQPCVLHSGHEAGAGRLPDCHGTLRGDIHGMQSDDADHQRIRGHGRTVLVPSSRERLGRDLPGHEVHPRHGRHVPPDKGEPEAPPARPAGREREATSLRLDIPHAREHDRQRLADHTGQCCGHRPQRIRQEKSAYTLQETGERRLAPGHPLPLRLPGSRRVDGCGADDGLRGGDVR